MAEPTRVRSEVPAGRRRCRQRRRRGDYAAGAVRHAALPVMKPAPLTALCVTVLFGAFAPCARAEASAEGSRATLPVLTASLALELEREDPQQ